MLTPMDSVPGVFPPAGVTLSQLPELPLVVAAAVNARVPELAATCTLCAAGTAPNDCALKVSALGVTAILGVADTVSVTGIFCGLPAAPVDEMETVPT